jgi:hypothetical protein
MTDYIAFDSDEKAYSIYEVNDDVIGNGLYCICKEPVFYKKQSKVFNDKYGNTIERMAHFSHYKNSNCSIKKLFKDDEDDEDDLYKYESPAPLLTLTDKRIKRIKTILKYIKKSFKAFKLTRIDIKNIIKEAKQQHIEYNQYINEYILKLLDVKTKLIGFKDIVNTKIENDIVYDITDIDEISFSYMNKICDEYDTYIIYVKSLSLIALYASRCREAKIIATQIEAFQQSIKEAIKNKKKSIFIKDD